MSGSLRPRAAARDCRRRGTRRSGAAARRAWPPSDRRFPPSGLSDVHFLAAEKSCWSRTIRARIRRPRSTPPSPLPKRLASPTGSNGITRQRHGSWLDMAESELAVLTTQCLSRRIPDKQTLAKEVAAWESHRNKHHAKADWQFTTENARVKLKRLYPQVGIPFTHVGTTGSAGGCIGRSIPSLGLITLGRFRSSWRGLTTSRLQAQSSTLYG